MVPPDRKLREFLIAQSPVWLTDRSSTTPLVPAIRSTVGSATGIFVLERAIVTDYASSGRGRVTGAAIGIARGGTRRSLGTSDPFCHTPRRTGRAVEPAMAHQGRHRAFPHGQAGRYGR